MTATPEALTPEERAYLIESFNVSAPAHVLRDDDDNHVTKLLRIHDQQAAALSALTEIPDAILEAWRTEGSVWQSNVAVEELARRGKRYTRAG